MDDLQGLRPVGTNPVRRVGHRRKSVDVLGAVAGPCGHRARHRVTAVIKEAPRTPPRAMVRTFWMVHRAIYRITGGRLGVWRPKSGTRFGTLRLTTVGRRTGQQRVAMIGYYPDGPNLVTLA